MRTVPDDRAVVQTVLDGRPVVQTVPDDSVCFVGRAAILWISFQALRILLSQMNSGCGAQEIGKRSIVL